MFPKKGKFFPGRERKAGTEIRFERMIADALRVELRGSGRTVKAIMEWTGASERTVKNWLAARTSPRAPHLICLMRHSEKVLGAVLQLSGREEVIAGIEVAAVRNICAEAVRRLDWLLCQR